MRILIADDDVIALELLRNALEGSGYDVTTVTNGQDAIDAFEQGKFRLVITDWEMPGMTGIDFCREVRSRSVHGYVYIILLTGRCTPSEIVEGMSAGADDFMVKPFQAAELLVRLRAGQRILALETRELVIFAMAKLAESRDPETGKHLERVQRYSRLLCEWLARNSKYADQIDPTFTQLVYQTSPLHDIGKVGIPDGVLLKAGRLTDDEFDVMKTHTLIGAETLDAALAQNPKARFLQVARDIALSHHERFDGRGYPYGLSGQTIPLAARIVAVADVYDALTSKRTYKDAYRHETARDIILKDCGTHFDPEIVAAFLAVEKEFIAIRQELAEDDETRLSPAARLLPSCVTSLSRRNFDPAVPEPVAPRPGDGTSTPGEAEPACV